MDVLNESRDFFLKKILSAFYECLFVCVPSGYLVSDSLELELQLLATVWLLGTQVLHKSNKTSY